MKILIFFLTFLFLTSCSFDNKSGIWKSENKASKKKENPYIDFEKLTSTNETFNKIIPFNINQDLQLSILIKNNEWRDAFYSKNNNYDNYSYSDLNNLAFKSKKLTKSKINENIFFEKGNLISTDEKGNIIIYSLDQNKIIKKFNFYKKKFKNLTKILNLIVENNIIYVSDNIGFLYAYDYEKNIILWAKNYKIPFQSNIKIFKDKILTSNLNNDFYFFNKKNGNVLRRIPTEETLVKNKFVNNLSILDNDIFYLNTYGSLYSIDNNTMKVNWFLNLNRSSNLNPNNLFMSNQVITYKDKIVVSSNNFFYVLEKQNGSIIFKKNFSSIIKPVISNNYLFILSRNELLILFDLKNGNIIYSYDINQKIADFVETKKKKADFRNIFLVNNKIFIFLNNSYVLKFFVNGNLEDIVKLPTKLNSNPIFVEGLLIFINQNIKI